MVWLGLDWLNLEHALLVGSW